MLKFRTMVDSAESTGEAVWASEHDARITPYGPVSLDPATALAWLRSGTPRYDIGVFVRRDETHARDSEDACPLFRFGRDANRFADGVHADQAAAAGAHHRQRRLQIPVLIERACQVLECAGDVAVLLGVPPLHTAADAAPEASVSELAGPLRMSLPAVMQHLGGALAVGQFGPGGAVGGVHAVAAGGGQPQEHLPGRGLPGRGQGPERAAGRRSGRYPAARPGSGRSSRARRSRARRSSPGRRASARRRGGGGVDRHRGTAPGAPPPG